MGAKAKKKTEREEAKRKLNASEDAGLRRLVSIRILNDCVEQFHAFTTESDHVPTLLDAFHRYQAKILSALKLRRLDTGEALEADILLINAEWVLEQSCATHHEYYRFVPSLKINRTTDGRVVVPKDQEGVATYAVWTSDAKKRGVVLAKNVHKATTSTTFYEEVEDRTGGAVKYKAQNVGNLYKSPPSAPPPYKCILSVPMTRTLRGSLDPMGQPEGDCLGVLNITHSQPTTFTQQDFAWAMACASLLGSLHASLYAKLPVSDVHPNEILLDARRLDRKQSQTTTGKFPVIQMPNHSNDDSFLPQQLDAARIHPWSLLKERDFLLETTKVDDLAEKEILGRLERYGVVLLRVGALTPDNSLLKSLENLLGPACDEQNDFVGKIKLIEPDPNKEAISGESGKELAAHVDGTQEPVIPPAMLAFQYLSGASHGGHSTFFDMADVLREFAPPDRTKMLTDLAKHDCAECKKDKKQADASTWSGHYKGPLIRPVLSDTGLSFRVRFDRVLRVAPTYQASFDKLQAAVLARGEDKRITFVPREGDIAIFDNWRVMHGRLEVSGRHERRHNRIWFKQLAARHHGTYNLGVRGLSVSNMHAVKQANGG